ncbi:hypothetical protein [Pleionea mediterranea]|uniref:Uncharacterized protein n=1 Tax=Pleionea mediterranea TaxID=523701 RepID=A0A316FAR7_9GAMM|nr:hypothetical protein [Pleionea mediterranea]PWK45355.1 hypothetical protein C8D97_11428 [Pleionea mediterranea]
MDSIVIIIFIILAALIIYGLISKKGKELMFGGKIIKTMENTPKGEKIRLVSSGVKVHVVEVAPQLKNVGLEISQHGLFNFSMVPVSLSFSDAKLLADTIYDAIGHNEKRTVED